MRLAGSRRRPRGYNTRGRLRLPAKRNGICIMNARRTLLVVLVLLAAPAVHAAEADLILHNGKIVAVDKQSSIHQALAIQGERILQVGTNADVLKTKSARTQLVDLQGKMVLPGLIDSHVHPTGA